MQSPQVYDFGLQVFGPGIADHELFAHRAQQFPPAIFADPWGDSIPNTKKEQWKAIEEWAKSSIMDTAVPVTPEGSEELSPLAYRRGRVDLFGMGIFNPHGPSLCSFGLLPTMDKKHWYLIQSFRHTMIRYDAVHAFLPSGSNDQATGVREAMMAILDIERFGQREIHAFSMPDFVLFGDQEIFPPDALKNWFAAHAPHRDFGQKTLRRVMDSYTRHQGKPWDRAAAAFSSGMDAAMERLSADPDKQPEAETELTSEQLEQWFSLVTSSTHVSAELAEIPRAWAGALKFASGGFRRRS